MASALGIPQDLLKSKMTCLREAAGSTLPLAAVMASISAALCEALGKQGSAEELRYAERARCEELLRLNDLELPDCGRAVP